MVVVSDDDFFKQMLGDGVEPLVQNKRAAVDKNRDSDVDKEARRRAAEDGATRTEDPLATNPVEMVDPLAVIAFRRPGVQHGVYKNLRLGKYTLEARLDMHRMTVEQARKALYQFVRDCQAHDVRSALVTHGKGQGRETPAMLKSCVAHWLPQLDEVLAFHTAQKQHGSYGATYVLFKKSETKRIENRELNRKR